MSSSEQFGRLFDPKQEYFVEERLRPHWSQAGAIVFITFRTADSIPQEVLARWDREKNDWLQRRGLLVTKHWSQGIDDLPIDIRVAFRKHFNRCREQFLDACHGDCVLRNEAVAKIVGDSLKCFDGDRYQLGDFVVMPNHVHLLSAFASPEGMKKQLTSWLHFTAVEINRLIGRNGHFWQPEPFDHLVRSSEQYEYLRKYIQDNPAKAHLNPGDYLYYQR
ncbi:MAG: transposase [Planctomycetota bacterium]